MPLEPGVSLGPYAVTAKIGTGGMGEVYKARDTRLDRWNIDPLETTAYDARQTHMIGQTPVGALSHRRTDRRARRLGHRDG